jgi:Mn-containing catalase
MPADSVGYPWNAKYMIASGNLLADFRHNLTAESQGRLQVVRLYEITDDPGVRDMLSFLIARDTMHQNQWLAAIEELEADGLEMTPAPSMFPQSLEKNEVAYRYMSFSNGEQSRQGRWAKGPSPDGNGKFDYVGDPKMSDDDGLLVPVDPRLRGTVNPQMAPAAPMGNGKARNGKKR